jgi:predicted CoA-binding protein
LNKETLPLQNQRKKTVVIGASPRPFRYSHSAVVELARFGHEVTAIGLREDKIGSIPIQTGFPLIDKVDTVTLYVGRKNQPPYYDYILTALKPQRIIMNPGTENDELKVMAIKKGIEVVENCTLMMLAHGMY